MRIAIDCDLRTSYAVSDTAWHERGENPLVTLSGIAVPPMSTILFEIASPVSFNRGHGSSAAMTQLAKWALWNVSWATRLAMRFEGTGVAFLVAPSNVWTMGHDEKTRHRIANCTLPKKDLRECEAMLFFHRYHPERWLSLTEYLARL